LSFTLLSLGSRRSRSTGGAAKRGRGKDGDGGVRAPRARRFLDPNSGGRPLSGRGGAELRQLRNVPSRRPPRGELVMRAFAFLLLATLVACQSPPKEEAPVDRTKLAAEAAATLDDFHAAAAAADGARYFGHFAADGVFLGTDATERWTLDEFRAYAKPHFDAGKGWTYHAKDRHVSVDTKGAYAWFDELLENAKLGTCRGSGV